MAVESPQTPRTPLELQTALRLARKALEEVRQGLASAAQAQLAGAELSADEKAAISGVWAMSTLVQTLKYALGYNGGVAQIVADWIEVEKKQNAETKETAS